MTTLDKLSINAQVRLLDLIASRHTAEVALLTLPALLAWLHSKQTGQTSPLFAWTVVMALAALGLVWMRRSFRADQQLHDASAMVRRWRTRMTIGGLIYGIGWSLPVILVGTQPSLEFSMALYIALCGVTMGSAVYLPAVLPCFMSLLAGIWVPAIFTVPALFPGIWPVVLAFAIVFCLLSLRHAWGTHRFLVLQIHLEESSRQLSEQFRLATERAEAAVREKNQFLTTASHDLRQPVHAMMMLVEAITRRTRDPAVTPLLQDLRSGMGSLNLMFNALLDLSRLESGHTPQQGRVTLQPLLQEVVTLFREQAAQRGLKLRLHTPERAAAVQTDPMLLRQALLNLVHNALRYTTQGGILIGLRSRGGEWQIEVCDTGSGIADSESEHIFVPYYRNPQAQRIDSAGLGLGLAVVAECAQRMGASLGFRSHLGRGSRFWLKLAQQEPGLETSGYTPFARLSGRCLILDDDPQVRSAWEALLTSWGIEGRYAGDATEAMHWLNAGFVPQAIFCDQRLRSRPSGFDVLRALLARCPTASGAMVSGELHSPELAQAEEEGYTVLHKPLDPGVLHTILSNWLHPA